MCFRGTRVAVARLAGDPAYAVQAEQGGRPYRRTAEECAAARRLVRAHGLDGDPVRRRFWRDPALHEGALLFAGTEIPVLCVAAMLFTPGVALSQILERFLMLTLIDVKAAADVAEAGGLSGDRVEGVTLDFDHPLFWRAPGSMCICYRGNDLPVVVALATARGLATSGWKAPALTEAQLTAGQGLAGRGGLEPEIPGRRALLPDESL